MLEITPDIVIIHVLNTIQMRTVFNVKICISWKIKFVGESMKVATAKLMMESVRTARFALSVGFT